MEHYEKYGVLLEHSPDWAVRERGFDSQGMGDCITRSCKTKNIKYLDVCAGLLKERKRWPDALQDRYAPFIATNRIDWEWSKLMYWFEIRETKKLRPQGGMTRDPFVYFFSSCAENGVAEFYKDVTVPFLVNRRKLKVWREYLLTGNPKALRTYEYLELRSLTFALKYYVVDLITARADGARSERVWAALADYDLELSDKDGFESDNKKNRREATERAVNYMKLKDVGI